MRKPVTPWRWMQPDEVRAITFDFTSKLNTGDAVSAVVGGALVVPPGITAGPPALVENKVTAHLSNPAVDTTYRVACRVITSQGETLELDVDIEVRDGAN